MKKAIVIHPFLFAIIPILYIYTHNYYSDRIPFMAVLIVIAICCACSFALYAVLKFLFKDSQFAGLILSVFLIFFFSYNHFFGFLNIAGFPNIFVNNRAKYALFLFLIALSMLLLMRLRVFKNGITKVLNYTVIFLVLLNLSTIVFGMAKHNQIAENPAIQPAKKNISAKNMPDIYYIILDGYANDKTLKRLYGYDNSEFIGYLKQKGFYVAENSKSNYIMTRLSIPSSLYMGYYPESAGDNRLSLKNKVREFVETKGYKYFEAAQMHNSSKSMDKYKLNEFIALVMRTTMLDPFANRLNLYSKSARGQILNMFDCVEEISKMKSPKFVFAHIMSPHPPYVFGRNGEEVKSLPLDIAVNIYKTNWDYKDAYLNQLIYVNKKTTALIDAILNNSVLPPIIVIQSDHGPLLELEGDIEYKVRLSILNAFYLPKGSSKMIYDSISPVNSFRSIFNFYFGSNLPLLEDKSYYSTFENPYNFIDVTDKTSYN